MTDELIDDFSIEHAVESAFGLKVEIEEVIARAVPTGYTSSAVIFKTSPNNLFIFVQSQTQLLLADVKKILRGMGIEAEEFLPPHADRGYFERIGTEKFKAMFPGKHIMSADDIRYYQTLAPYSPALARISKIKGEIRGFNFESKSWRKVRDYAFSRIPLD